MSDFVYPTLAEQATILHAFIGRSSFSLSAARATVDALVDIDEARLAPALRQRFCNA